MPISVPDPSFFLDDGLTAHAPAGAGLRTEYGLVDDDPVVFAHGAGGTPWRGLVAFDVLEISAGGDRTYLLEVEGSNTEDFSGAVQTLSSRTVGAVGQQLVPLFSQFSETLYAYFRLKLSISGTAPAIKVRTFVQPLSAIEGLTLAQQVAVLGMGLANFNAAVTNLREWMAGPAEGGVGGDGYFPLSDGAGNTLWVPSPDRIATLAAPYVVGLFDALGSRNIPAGVERIQTTGKSEFGKGAAVYVKTTTMGETSYRKQSADGAWWELEALIPSALDFGWSATDNSSNLLALFAWCGSAGRAAVLAPLTMPYLDRLEITQAYLCLQGVGWASILDGPGLFARGTVNTHNGPGNLIFRQFQMLGTSYQDDGDRAIDILATNEVVVEGLRIEGFHDQVCIDQVQRSRIRTNRFHASAGTRCGLWFPRGPEAHVGVSLASSASNIASVDDNHFNWVNNDDGWAIVDHGGLQHRYTNNQVSQGRAAMRIGNSADITIAHADYEFTTTYSLECVNTAFDGTVIGYASQVNVGPGNYFDKPAKVDNVFCLNVRDNNLRVIPATFTGMASVRMLRSSGNKCPTGRTIYDAMPAADGWSWDRADEEGAVAKIGQSAEDGIEMSGPLSISNSSGGHTGLYQIDDGTGRSRWFYISDPADLLTAREFLRLNTSSGYVQFGNSLEGMVGARIFSGESDPTTITIPGVVDGSIYIQKLAASTAYAGQNVLWTRANGAWLPYRSRIPTTTKANLLARSAATWAGAQFLVSDVSSKLATSNGSNWVYADGTVVS